MKDAGLRGRPEIRRDDTRTGGISPGEPKTFDASILFNVCNERISGGLKEIEQKIARQLEEIITFYGLRELNAQVEYVRPSVVSQNSDDKTSAKDLESLEKNCASLLEALQADDDAEVQAATISIRRRLKEIRDSSKTSKIRRYFLGAIYDAMTFTDLSGISAGDATVLKQAIVEGVATPAEKLPSSATLRLRMGSNFDFTPRE